MLCIAIGLFGIAIFFVVVQAIRWRRALADRNAAVAELNVGD